jgi:5-methylcytosine-specific restriction endonuclease McrA
MDLNDKFVLVLNANWHPVGLKRLKDTLVVTYDSDNWYIVRIENMESDNPILLPISWSEWEKLPPLQDDEKIATAHKDIRLPTVVIAKNYKKIHLKKLIPNRQGIFIRDKGICQYSGKKIPVGDATLDHIIPKSRGGKDTWHNLVLCDKKINHKKGDKTPKEAGLKLLREPYEPDLIPLTNFLPKYMHDHWKYFIKD